jgi:nitrogen regulatory protein PII
MERKLESRAVKQALVKAGFTGVTVTHGTGTAHCWLEIGVNCDDNREAWNRTDREVIRIAMQVTGRHGDYDGRISVHTHQAVAAC